MLRRLVAVMSTSFANYYGGKHYKVLLFKNVPQEELAIRMTVHLDLRLLCVDGPMHSYKCN